MLAAVIFGVCLGVGCYNMYTRPIPFHPRLQKAVAYLWQVFPDLKNVRVISYYTTTCINKHTICICITPQMTDTELLDCILHEYAHVLNKSSYGHGPEYLEIYYQLVLNLREFQNNSKPNS